MSVHPHKYVCFEIYLSVQTLLGGTLSRLKVNAGRNCWNVSSYNESRGKRLILLLYPPSKYTTCCIPYNERPNLFLIKYTTWCNRNKIITPGCIPHKKIQTTVFIISITSRSIITQNYYIKRKILTITGL